MLNQQSFEVTLPAPSSLTRAHQEYSTIFVNAREALLKPDIRTTNFLPNKEKLRKIKEDRKGNGNLGQILSLAPVSLQGGSFPSGLLSDQQLSDFLNFTRLLRVPWLPMKPGASAASESWLLPVLSSIFALALAAGSPFLSLIFHHGQILLGKEDSLLIPERWCRGQQSGEGEHLPKGAS